MGKISNAFNIIRSTRSTPKGNVGYDNARENIDPHIKTQVVSSKEIELNAGDSTTTGIYNTYIGASADPDPVCVVH